mgnify:CR=1 FL=1
MAPAPLALPVPATAAPAPRFCLAPTFPALSQNLGGPHLPALELAFGAFAGANAEPAAGAYLPGFLAGAPGYQDRPELVELAAFEWALFAAAQAPDRPVLPPGELGGLSTRDWGALRVILHPCLTRVGTEWNSVALWRAVQQETRPPSPVREPCPRAWAVWRHATRSRFRPLPMDDAVALDLAARGRPFGEICRTLWPEHPPSDAAARAAAMVGDWMAAGWVSGLSRRSY